MEIIHLREDFIKLGQAIKAVHFVSNGAAAKEEILAGNVKVNGEVSLQRGKKLYEGDIVEFKGQSIKIEK